MDRVKNDFVPPSHAPNWTSRQSCFLAVILSRLVLKNMTVKWLKKKIVCCAKIWKPPRQHFGLFEDWRNFGNPRKFGKFLKLGVALILRDLLTDLLLIQTKLALVRPGPKGILILLLLTLNLLFVNASVMFLHSVYFFELLIVLLLSILFRHNNYFSRYLVTVPVKVFAAVITAPPGYKRFVS